MRKYTKEEAIRSIENDLKKYAGVVRDLLGEDMPIKKALEHERATYWRDTAIRVGENIAHAPEPREIREYMELYNADEIGLENPITYDEAETLLLNDDKYNHYNK